MTTPAEREYVTFRRGEVRESFLRDFREGLRGRVDPMTGQLFTEDTLRRATSRGAPTYRHADSIDLVLLGVQRRDEFFAQQIRIDRSGSAFLRAYHAILWGEDFLPAFGGSGVALAKGLPGTTWFGSTTIPDPFADVATDGGGRRYQVLTTGTADGNGEVPLALAAINGGDETNIAVGSKLKWVSPPPGSEESATVTGLDFAGGQDAELDADFAKRLSDRVRHKPASGNWAHLRAFARAASVSVEDAFVYPCAFHAGSTLVAVVQKRGASTLPTARVPSFSVLNAVRQALVPPSSPNVPGRSHVVVVPVQTVASDLVVRLSQPFASVAGWRDLEPFPKSHNGNPATISQVLSPTQFRLTTSQPGQLPGNPGLGVPVEGIHMMVWDESTSTFEDLHVDEVEELSPSESGRYLVSLSQAPTRALTLGDWVSPDMQRRDALAAAVRLYFDSLGPGEVVDLSTDERSSRAYRNPMPNEEAPQRAGYGAITTIAEALGSPISDAELVSFSVSAPPVPADPIDGPNLIVPGNFSVYVL